MLTILGRNCRELCRAVMPTQPLRVELAKGFGACRRPRAPHKAISLPCPVEGGRVQHRPAGATLGLCAGRWAIGGVFLTFARIPARGQMGEHQAGHHAELHYSTNPSPVDGGMHMACTADARAASTDRRASLAAAGAARTAPSQPRIGRAAAGRCPPPFRVTDDPRVEDRAR